MTRRLQIILLLSFLYVNINTQNPESPCPRLFVYETRPNSEPDRWYGIITLLSDRDLKGIWLRIMLDKPAVQLGNWFGEALGREQNKDFLIRNRTATLKANEPQPVQFFVQYAPNETPPRLTGFRLNAQPMCPEGLVEATTMSMELQTSNEVVTGPTPRPAGSSASGESNSVFTSDNSGGGGGLFTSDNSGGEVNKKPENRPPPPPPPPSTQKPVAPRPPLPPPSGGNNNAFFKPGGGFNLGSSHFTEDDDEYFPGDYSFVNGSQNNFNLNDICGTTIPSRSPKESSQETTEGQFPWHVAIYRTKGINLVYWCGGTLISSQHVITVAHCVTKWKSQEPQETDGFVIYLGKYYLNRFTDASQERLIQEIIPHPKYEPKILCNDLAILKLKSPVEITDYVRPACIWQDSPNLNAIVDQPGTVVGWGVNEHGKLTQQLAQAQMPVSSVETCTYSLPTFYPLFASNTTYCATFVRGTYVCNGDSGGGMVLPKLNQNKVKWQLRGLVSFSVDLNNRFRCEQSHYVVFTDTAQYLDWIRNAIQK